MIKYKQINSNAAQKSTSNKKSQTPFSKKKTQKVKNFNTFSKPTFSSYMRSRSSSLNNNKNRSNEKNKQQSSDKLKPKIKHSKTTSSDLLDHYNKILDISKKMTSINNFTLESHQQDLNYQELADKQNDLFCDQELQNNPKFSNNIYQSILRTPEQNTHSINFSKYFTKELPVVQERIISEEQKQYISEKKLKKETPRYNKTNNDKNIVWIQSTKLNSANTASPFGQKIQNQTKNDFLTAFQIKIQKTSKIKINVNSLIKQSRSHKIQSIKKFK